MSRASRRRKRKFKSISARKARRARLESSARVLRLLEDRWDWDYGKLGHSG